MSDSTTGETTAEPHASDGERDEAKDRVPAALRWYRIHKRHDHQWILGEVEATRATIQRLSLHDEEESPGVWRRQAEELLRQTENSIRANEVQRAWLSLKAARRACIFAMGDQERLAYALELKSEAGKIESEWRAEAIRQILKLSTLAPSGADREKLRELKAKGDTAAIDRFWVDFGREWLDENVGKPLDGEALAIAAALRDEHYDNIWRKIDRRRSAILTSVVTLGVITLAIVLFWNFFADWCWFQVEIKGEMMSLVLVALFGALGATLSSAYTLASADLPDKFTQGAMTVSITAMRPSIGAAAALATLFIYAGGLMDGIVGKDMFMPNVIYAVVFTSGFSERLIFSATKKIADRAAK